MSHAKKASLIIVGSGMTAGQFSIEAECAIRASDVVFELVPDWQSRQLIEQWHPHVRSLSGCYQRTATRIDAYAAMVQELLQAVRENLVVCAVFYGHPGVFVHPSHEAIRQVRAEGYSARMLPGISAEDCLFADLGVDPGQSGCQSHEASAFLFYRRIWDPGVTLVLWQIGVIGDHRCMQWTPHPLGLQLLQQQLLLRYPATHGVCLYEAATQPLWGARKQWLPLSALAEAEVSTLTTLYVPAYGEVQLNSGVLEALSITPAELAGSL